MKIIGWRLVITRLSGNILYNLAGQTLLSLVVLVAAKYARALNEFPGGASRDKKLTTKSLEELAKGDIDYRVVPRRRSAE